MRNYGRLSDWLRRSVRQATSAEPAAFADRSVLADRIGTVRRAIGYGLILAVLGPMLGACAQKTQISKRLAQPTSALAVPLQSLPSHNMAMRAPPVLSRPALRLPPLSAPRRRPARSISRYDRRTGVYASERLVTGSRAVAKGGGSYKLGKPYQVSGRWYVPKLEPNYIRTGTASWYGDKFHGRRTANGETYDMRALSAAHPTMPLPSYAYVTNLSNGRTVMVRVNDRGPYARDRLIDLSRAAASALDFRGKGVAKVQVRYAGRAPLNGSDERERAFLRRQSWAGALQQTPRLTGASGLTRARTFGARRRVIRRRSVQSAKSRARVPSWAWRPVTNYLAR